MKKTILIATLAALTLAFTQANENKFTSIENNSSALLAQKGNKGGSKNKGGSNKKSTHEEKSNSKSNKPSGLQPSNGNGNKGNKSPENNPSNFEKENKRNKSNGNYKNDKGHTGKNKKKPHEKGHPNHGYVYVNNHGYFSHSNYGHWRSQQARNKHNRYHPYYEYQAIEGFNLIILRNGFLYTETDYKINLINVRLAERRKANLITVVQYDMYMDRIAALQQRRAALQINIVL